MKKNFNKALKLVLVFTIIFPVTGISQTEMDAIMMNKNQFCTGLIYDRSTWDHYWEGSYKRNNENLGEVSTQSLINMSAYGITNNLNVMAGAPYVWTKASAGTLLGMKGFQDLSIFIKWKALTSSFGNNKVSLIVLGGVSTPLSNYVVDFLPMSIGMGSTNLTAKTMLDYQWKNFTVTGSAAFIQRSNNKLDRDSYYDTELHLTNEVKMPNASQLQLRTGYRGKYIIAEALLTKWTTLGGFDISKNNMPFPSNRMNATMIGMNIKYTLKNLTNLSLLAGTNYTVAGKNVGQSKAFNLGAFYAFYVNKK